MPEAEARALVRRAQVMRLGVVDAEGEAYVVPLNYGYDAERGVLWVHSAPKGRKLDVIAVNPRVCFEVDECEVVPSDRPCGWTARFESVIGYGIARVLEDPKEKTAALAALTSRYSGNQEDGGSIPAASVEKTAVIEIAIESMDGKRHG